MSEEAIRQIEQLLESNARLLTRAKEKVWDNFSRDVEEYSCQLRILCQTDFYLLTGGQKERVAVLLQTLSAQDRLLMPLLRSRLDELGSGIAALQKQRTSARAYQALRIR